MLDHLKKFDWLVVAAAVSLTSFGLISLYGDGELTNFKKQILWLAIGFVLMIAVSLFDYRLLKNYSAPSFLLYIFSAILLAGVLVFGTSIRGAESWYRIGAITVEPVEFVKVAVILLFAKYFSMRHIEMYRVSNIIASGFYICIPVGLVLLQREVGSVLILFSIWVGIMIIAGIKIKHLVALGVLGCLSFFLAWSLLFQQYQKDRLIAFLNPEADPRGSGYNVLQSVTAVGSGGIWGKGIGRGTQTQLGFLPEPQTDFIYAAIVEEMGFAGAILMLTCFVFLFKRTLKILRSSANNFARLVVAGFLIALISQIFINMGMTLGILPITGIPLPFVSYGGSSLISLYTMLGILQSIRVNR